MVYFEDNYPNTKVRKAATNSNKKTKKTLKFTTYAGKWEIDKTQSACRKENRENLKG